MTHNLENSYTLHLVTNPADVHFNVMTLKQPEKNYLNKAF